MDRNSTIGLIIISALLFAYFTFFAPDAKQLAQEKQEEASKIESIKPQQKEQNVLPDSVLNKKLGSLASIAKGEEKEYILENKDLKIALSTKGGKINSVLAKNYLTYGKQPVYLFDQQASELTWMLPLGQESTNLYDLYFTKVDTETSGDTTRIIFTAALAADQYIKQVYSLASTGFSLDYKVNLKGISQLNENKPVLISWKQKLRNFEKDAEQNRLASTVNYYTQDEEFDKLNETAKEPLTETIEDPVKWVALKQKFFNTALISETPFKNVQVASSVDPNDTEYVKYLSANLEASPNNANYKFYFGPNQYQICKKVTEGFEENVYLGWPILNNLNRFVTVPIFNFLERFFTNYGIIIFLLVLIIKAALFPLSYKSYLSMAKMRVLKPELDEIKARHGGDMQKSQADQMKLYQSVGVNPISGCIPVLLTMPVLLAIFNFFPNSIELRQESFLWADDLSTYDVIANLPFTIPFYGNHVSLFTILMTISTLVYTWYNNQMSASSMQGPMVAMSYIMPVILLFVLNSLPAGLSYYYFISNVVTIGQQLLIKSFVDETKIRAKLDANKVKLATEPSKQNRFMKRLEDAMKQQEELKKKRLK